MDSIPASAVEEGGKAPTQTEFPLSSLDSFPSIPFFRSKSARIDTASQSSTQKEDRLVLKNKSPRWHEQLQCWCLNFRGRVTVASVKNFQLVASDDNGSGSQENDKVILQFGNIGKDLFTMDYRYPISAFQAFSICLSSFDTKIACEWGKVIISAFVVLTMPVLLLTCHWYVLWIASLDQIGPITEQLCGH